MTMIDYVSFTPTKLLLSLVGPQLHRQSNADPSDDVSLPGGVWWGWARSPEKSNTSRRIVELPSTRIEWKLRGVPCHQRIWF